jgi:hypothetical protein
MTPLFSPIVSLSGLMQVSHMCATSSCIHGCLLSKKLQFYAQSCGKHWIAYVLCTIGQGLQSTAHLVTTENENISSAIMLFLFLIRSFLHDYQLYHVRLYIFFTCSIAYCNTKLLSTISFYFLQYLGVACNMKYIFILECFLHFSRFEINLINVLWGWHHRSCSKNCLTKTKNNDCIWHTRGVLTTWFQW